MSTKSVNLRYFCFRIFRRYPLNTIIVQVEVAECSEIYMNKSNVTGSVKLATIWFPLMLIIPRFSQFNWRLMREKSFLKYLQDSD